MRIPGRRYGAVSPEATAVGMRRPLRLVISNLMVCALLASLEFHSDGP
jgi:hypothetical protein